MDRDLLRRPETWAIAVPLLCLVLALHGVWTLGKVKGRAERQAQAARDAVKDATRIERFLQQAGGAAAPGMTRPTFNDITSARQCAAEALIGESRLSRGESAKPQAQRDGTVLRRETYRLDGVSLEQVSRFIDCAELNYDTLNCTQAALTRERGKGFDRWNVTVTLQYLVK